MAFSLFLSSSLAKKDGEVGDAQGDSYGCPCLCSPALHGEAWPELLMAEGEEPASSESAALSLSSLDKEVGEPRPPPSCDSDGRRASGSSKRRLYVQQRVCMGDGAGRQSVREVLRPKCESCVPRVNVQRQAWHARCDV